MKKIDVIIDALSVAQSSVWSALNQEALAYAIELKVELAKPEPQVCCGDYEKCIKACTPRGRWLAEQELAKPEQASNEPPDYVEPPTSDYHNGWEEGFEAAKNLFKGKNT
jgi:hypothetical protein